MSDTVLLYIYLLSNLVPRIYHYFQNIKNDKGSCALHFFFLRFINMFDKASRSYFLKLLKYAQAIN